MHKNIFVLIKSTLTYHQPNVFNLSTDFFDKAISMCLLWSQWYRQTGLPNMCSIWEDVYILIQTMHHFFKQFYSKFIVWNNKKWCGICLVNKTGNGVNFYVAISLLKRKSLEDKQTTFSSFMILVNFEITSPPAAKVLPLSYSTLVSKKLTWFFLIKLVGLLLLLLLVVVVPVKTDQIRTQRGHKT